MTEKMGQGKSDLVRVTRRLRVNQIQVNRAPVQVELPYRQVVDYIF